MHRFFLHHLILVAMLLVMADLRPCLAQGVMIVQSSSAEAYQNAVSAFNQELTSTISLPGIASVQPAQTFVLDPAVEDPESVVDRNYHFLRPEVVVAVGNQALEAVKDLNCPIVYLLVANPDPIVQQRPNITGITMMPGPLPQLAAIKAAFPTVRRIGILFDPSTSSDFVTLARKAAGTLDLSLVQAPASADREAILLISSLVSQIDAIWLMPEPSLISQTLLKGLALVSLEKRIPMIAFAPKYLEFGAAMAIFASPEQLGRQAAELAKQLLSAPSRKAIKPEYGRTTTVQTNDRIIQTLDIIFNQISPSEGIKNL